MVAPKAGMRARSAGPTFKLTCVSASKASQIGWFSAWAAFRYSSRNRSGTNKSRTERNLKESRRKSATSGFSIAAFRTRMRHTTDLLLSEDEKLVEEK